MTEFYVREYRESDKIVGYDVRRSGTQEAIAFFGVSDWGAYAARDGAYRLVDLLSAKTPNPKETV